MWLTKHPSQMADFNDAALAATLSSFRLGEPVMKGSFLSMH